MNVWIGGDTSVKPEDLARARWPDPDTGHSSTFLSQAVAGEGAIEEQHLDDNEEAGALVMAEDDSTTGSTWEGVRSTQQTTPSPFCTSRSCEQFSSILQDALSYDEEPCSDFYQFVCKRWSTRLPHEYTVKAQHQHRIVALMRRVLDALPHSKASSSSELKAARLYWTCTQPQRNLEALREFMRIEGVAPDDEEPGEHPLKFVVYLNVRFGFETIFNVGRGQDGTVAECSGANWTFVFEKGYSENTSNGNALLSWAAAASIIRACQLNRTSPSGRLVYPMSTEVTFSSEAHTLSVPAALLMPPFFGSEGLPGINYGALGLAASSALMGLLEVFLSGDQYSGADDGGGGFGNRLECLKKSYHHDMGADRGLLNKMAALRDFVGLLPAYKAFVSTASAQRLKGLEWMTEEQLFFVAFCYQQCENADDERSSEATSRCNVPLRHTPQFADAFNCSPGSPMVSPEPCTFWNELPPRRVVPTVRSSF
ncbi:hypothetical protein HPB50_029491 [Hyalomma asiaticum]|nr:hypothetical protein HPB50_029491 [Hyalomma asiaticum]